MTTIEDDCPILQEQPTNDRPFNPFRIPGTAKAQALVAEVLGQIQSFERVKGLRQRQRRPADQQTFETTVTAAICDLMHRAITCPEGWVSVSLSNQHLGRASRYRPPALGKALPDILDRLSAPEMAFLKMEKGHLGYFGPARRTVIQAGPRLQSRIQAHGINPTDLGESSSQEVIVLKRERDGFWDEGGLVEYEDDEVTRQYRSEMRLINEWLATADIQFDLSILSDSSQHVDDTDRHLRRYFTKGSFEKGGRLFGGFWQPMSKRLRRKGLLIDCDEIVTLDFGQMAPRILYGLAGATAGAQDAYLLPGLEAHRQGVKKVLNAVLFADKRLTRFPKGTRELLPARVAFEDVLEKLGQIHAPIRHLFHSEIGHRVQFVESEILVDVLLTLRQQGITGLPVHDAVIIPRSSILEVTAIMLEVFKAHTGLDGLISQEGD
jgi:hypothetical protein